ncbi:MAG: hypothetical protein FJX54_02720 [Alphaproteobacteria bacterium]|nr:hypothetical protein [Alphaproteobacteria bacterium]
MIRRSTLFWLVCAVLIGCGLYQLKYEVQAKEERLVRLNRQIQAEQEAIHVLNAEWAFLNRPDRLADLANRHLEMTPVAPAQFGKVAAIPERSLIPVEAEAEAPVVAAKVVPAKTPTKPAPSLKTQIVEAKRPSTLHVARAEPVAKPFESKPLEFVSKPFKPDVVVIVDGALLANVRR